MALGFFGEGHHNSSYMQLNLVSRLAATLGPKSHFRKLAKRSVLSADIPQLCQLISEPPEPLALRLSSNLMVGVVRYELNFRLHQIGRAHV